MKGADLLTLLLLLLSWRRQYGALARHKRSDPGTLARDKYHVSWMGHEDARPPIRHYRVLQNHNNINAYNNYYYSSFSALDSANSNNLNSNNNNNDDVILSNNVVTQNNNNNYYDNGLAQPPGRSVSSSKNNNNNNILINSATSILNGKIIRHSSRFLDRIGNPSNLTVSEFMWNLREMDRSRRRRSSSANLNLDTKRFNGTWPLKKVAEIDGDIFLGGLMMVHEREDTIMCGPIMPQGGIQALETMLYTVDTINNKKDFLPFKLGVHILDDCDKDTYGLEQAVDFIKGSISNIDDIDPNKCADIAKGKKNKVISGVVGAASSVTSIQVANLLRLFKIPQVSYFSTSPELSNKNRFEFFSRTIPSDTHQVRAMVEIVKLFRWSYISIIYEESNYGIKAFEELEKILPTYNICIAAKEKLTKDSGVAGANSYDRIVDKLLGVSKAKGVIVFGSDQEVKGLMQAVGRRNATTTFTWIGSDGWSGRTLVSLGNEREVEGTLAVQPRANPVIGFDEYFFKLNVKNYTRNPWFVEFWEHHFSCKYPNSSRTPYNENYKTLCTGEEKLTPENTPFEAQLQYVSDAVMAFAWALKDMYTVECNGTNKICERMNPIDGIELLRYLQKVKFTGLSNDSFHFDQYGDGPARYNIIHFRRKDANNSTYEWIRVGQYDEGTLDLNMTAIRFADGSSTPPISVCSDPCDQGEAKRFVGSDTCCWSCLKCLNFEIRHPEDESVCFLCPLGTRPNRNHTECIPIYELYLRPTSGWAIGAMTFAGVGILLTVFVSGVFLNHNDTPVVRASGRELSYVLLSGLFSCYALTFLFVFRPNDIVCGLQQFGTGFCFTLVYAALLTKTNRIARIFQAGRRSARRPSFISPRSQLVICGTLVFIQVAINVVWMLLQPPKAMHHYPTREDNLLVCNSYINASYTIAFAYPLGLIVVCTVYAVLTRKIPEAFNESKYIGFTMYTTCIIWLAFVPIYFSTANQVALRITSMTVAISLSATVMIVCLFFPKLYIILFHPERNVRQSMMPGTRYSAVGGATTPGTTSHTNAAGGIPGPGVIQMTALKQNHNFTSINQRVDSATQSDILDHDCKYKPVNCCSESGGRTLLCKQIEENGGMQLVNCATQTMDEELEASLLLAQQQQQQAHQRGEPMLKLLLGSNGASSESNRHERDGSISSTGAVKTKDSVTSMSDTSPLDHESGGICRSNSSLSSVSNNALKRNNSNTSHSTNRSVGGGCISGSTTTAAAVTTTAATTYKNNNRSRSPEEPQQQQQRQQQNQQKATEDVFL